MQLESQTDLVSVVIPAYNCAPFIGEAIDSVLNQSFKRIEIIVVNDGSTDETSGVLRNYEDKIRVIDIPNSGISVARNIGILWSRGSFVAFLDADDIWLEHKLERQMEKISSEDAEFVFSSGFTFSVSLNQGDRKIVGVVDDYDQMKFKYMTVPGFDPICPSGLLVRKSSLSKSGIFNPLIRELGEGYDLHRRLVKNLEGAYISEPLFLYRKHSNNTSNKPLHLYFQGNRKALTYLIADEQYSIFMKILLNARLYFSFLKSYIARLLKN